MLTYSPIVLCVDDDLDDLQILIEIIQELDQNIEVATAFNGMEALQYLNTAKFEQRLPCLIIMDINMPYLDGKETLVRIKKQELFMQIPIVILSTSTSLLDKTFCNQWDVAFITKPVKEKDLKETIRTLMNYCKSE